ncbi:MAG: hypothetical protein JO149_07855, partial [Gammaproteobacteria bacterium]|nr:hypothetical protein [Gammaproteobacteria bacterium]
MNDGDIDIEGNRTEKPISIELPDGLTWIKTIITNSTKNLISSVNIHSDNKIVDFEFGLFRKKEFIQFEAIIEANSLNYDEDNLFKKLQISHRIANTQQVKVIELLEEEKIVIKKKKIKRQSIIFGAYALIMIIAFPVFAYFVG